MGYKMKMIYIASPYTLGDKIINVNRQLDTADRLMDLGLCPVIPLLTHFQEIRKSRMYKEWMRIDFEKIRRSDAVLRLFGASKGADREVRYAVKKQIPVFFDIEDVIKGIM